MADRNVAPEQTFADFRETYIGTCTDIGNMNNLNASFTGTPTDIVEALGSKATRAFSIAMPCALG